MRRFLIPLVAVAAAVAVIWTTGLAQTPLPSDVASYRGWTRMNARLLTDPSNPRAGPKNTFINLPSTAIAAIVGKGGRVQRPFPVGTVAVRESLDPQAGFVRVLFVMRKDPTAKNASRGWVWSGYARTAESEQFQALPIPDPLMRCAACHMQVGASDLVFTPFTNRPDASAAPTPSQPDRVELFNYAFGPRELRVRRGASVTFANYDLVPHDVKAADRSFESGNLPTLARHFQSFDRSGSFDYFCNLHLEMRGRIIVE